MMQGNANVQKAVRYMGWELRVEKLTRVGIILLPYWSGWLEQNFLRQCVGDRKSKTWGITLKGNICGIPKESSSLKGDKELTQDKQAMTLKDKIIPKIKSPGMLLLLFCLSVLQRSQIFSKAEVPVARYCSDFSFKLNSAANKQCSAWLKSRC